MLKTKEELRLMNILDSLKARYRITYNERHDGRNGAAVLLKIDNKFYYGMSYCSHLDQFDKKIGRVAALGRAYAAYLKKEDVPLDKIAKTFRFKEDKDK